MGKKGFPFVIKRQQMKRKGEKGKRKGAKRGERLKILKLWEGFVVSSFLLWLGCVWSHLL